MEGDSPTNETQHKPRTQNRVSREGQSEKEADQAGCASQPFRTKICNEKYAHKPGAQFTPGQQDSGEKNARSWPDDRDTLRLENEQQAEPRHAEIYERGGRDPENISPKS
jgi:rubrerythrin